MLGRYMLKSLAVLAALTLVSCAATAAPTDQAPNRRSAAEALQPKAGPAIRQADARVSRQAKRKRSTAAARHRSKYGFLPGYRPPEVIEEERARARYENGPRWYGLAVPGFYRGRWNGGGFGPCYTYTPIGYVWNCGR